ncbi:MAG: conjugal transfer protein TraG N-terminal domain-containing protein [Gammaproteobacteria bacterium]|nr:conjugal transfer protein TraG N-terminal domain-containing protein [Gammaproteobacteria bacterium]
MIVFSPLSLYTTYLGWQQYEVLFIALWQTGLLYLGFLFIAYRFLKNVLAPAGSTHHAADHALNHFLYELAVTVFICSIFVYPCVPLEARAIQFKPMCGLKHGALVKSSIIGDSGTTYDEAFADLLSPQVKIPIGFAFLQNYISSFTYGLMKVTGCTDSLQSIEGDLVSSYLPWDVREQALAFHAQCFREARTQFNAEKHDDEAFQKTIKQYGGEDDLNWMGSMYFQKHYYNQLHARKPVPGFSFNEAPNPNLKQAAARGDIDKAHLPGEGYPSCNQWWKQLRGNLVRVASNASIFNRHLNTYAVLERVRTYKNKHPKSWHTDISAEDFIAKLLLNHSKDLQARSTQTLMDNTNGKTGQTLSHGLVNFGQWTKSWTSTPLKREAIMQTLPVMQAFFMFFLIVLTPVILAFSGYSPKALGSLCGLFVMSIFLQYLWHLVGFVERGVLDPLGDNEAISAMRNMAVMFYFVAPLLLLRLSGHFGAEAGAGMGALVSESLNQSKEVAQSGKSAASIAGQVAGRGLIR